MPRPAPHDADALRDLELLVRSRYGLIQLRGAEPERCVGLLRHLADRLGVPMFVWSPLKGLRRDGLRGAVYGTAEPAGALAHITASGTGAVYLLQGLGPALPGLLPDHLREAARTLEGADGALVVVGELDLPADLARHAATVTLPGPEPREYGELLSRLVRDLSGRQPVDVDLGAEERASLVRQLAGLTLLEAEKILTKAIIEDGCLGADDVRHVVEAKKAIIERQGLLEYYPVEDSFAGVADLAGLKAWLAKRRNAIEAPLRAEAFGLDFPRGILLVGVPGCGKSLSAKAVAMEWRLPLLKLDPSNLYNKYIGESERNFKRAMSTAERMAPVVLWIDELEKAFAAGGDADSGVSERVLGSFLSWLQERRGDVFVVATANDVTRLPPELVRKGRFDEIFFVDLPDARTRGDIFALHLGGRGHDPAAFALGEMAAATEGFSGAEIEQVVVAALYTAFGAEQPLSDTVLHEEIRRTRPLSVTMAERVAGIRAWARNRTVPAG